MMMIGSRQIAYNYSAAASAAAAAAYAAFASAHRLCEVQVIDFLEPGKIF